MRKTPALSGLCLLLMAVVLASCDPGTLTAEKAESILRVKELRPEPVYAEVPQRVWWNAKSPRDDYDGKALKTLRKMGRFDDNEMLDDRRTRCISSADETLDD